MNLIAAGAKKTDSIGHMHDFYNLHFQCHIKFQIKESPLSPRPSLMIDSMCMLKRASEHRVL